MGNRGKRLKTRRWRLFHTYTYTPSVLVFLAWLHLTWSLCQGYIGQRHVLQTRDVIFHSILLAPRH